MKNILIIGAGKSSTFLIEHLLQYALEKDLMVTVADLSVELAQKKIKNHPKGKAVSIDLNNPKSRKIIINDNDLVISMLPAQLHKVIAEDCLELGKHFFTASYESDDLRKMKAEIEANNLLFLNECGLDPGIDHMSAKQIIDREKRSGNTITAFKSFTGGVLAPESEDNPWKYKFTWNPRNVVLAGQGVSRYIRNGKLKFIPYHMLFRRVEKIDFPEVGEFEGYANRDSLIYRSIYGLEDVPTLLRGTLRRTGFCKSWDVFVQLGMTDNSFEMSLPEGYTNRDFINSFLPYHESSNVEEKLVELFPWIDEPILVQLAWLEIFKKVPLQKTKGSPADILQTILEKKWALRFDDKDMIVMQHSFEIKTSSGLKTVTSSLVCKGQNEEYTAMAKTVGLPLAIAVELFLEDKIQAKGLRLPITPEFYDPILARLQNEGIIFNEITRS